MAVFWWSSNGTISFDHVDSWLDIAIQLVATFWFKWHFDLVIFCNMWSMELVVASVYVRFVTFATSRWTWPWKYFMTWLHEAFHDYTCKLRNGVCVVYCSYIWRRLSLSMVVLIVGLARKNMASTSNNHFKTLKIPT